MRLHTQMAETGDSMSCEHCGRTTDKLYYCAITQDDFVGTPRFGNPDGAYCSSECWADDQAGEYQPQVLAVFRSFDSRKAEQQLAA